MPPAETFEFDRAEKGEAVKIISANLPKDECRVIFDSVVSDVRELKESVIDGVAEAAVGSNTVSISFGQSCHYVDLETDKVAYNFNLVGTYPITDKGPSRRALELAGRIHGKIVECVAIFAYE